MIDILFPILTAVILAMWLMRVIHRHTDLIDQEIWSEEQARIDQEWKDFAARYRMVPGFQEEPKCPS